MLCVSEQPVIDSHCHAFLPEKETDPFEQYLTLAMHPVPKEDMVNTFIYRQVVRELSRVLNVEGAHEEIIDERQRRYKEDPEGYIKLLFNDAKIEALLVDTGYPSKEFSGYSIDLEYFSKIVPCEVREIFRIDIVVYNILRNRLPLDETVEQFHKQIRNAVKEGAVGLKSVIAYRTGLEIQRGAEEDVREAYRDFIAETRKGKTVRDILSSRAEHVKALLDYFVFLGVEDSVEIDVPFQIHVGMGDAPIIDLRIANPILLHNLLNDESARNARIVLTHGGYPYIEEAVFLVNSYPNLFLDVSETIPFISIGIKEKLFNLLEMAPTTKIMHGSDGYNIPEIHWISALLSRRALSAILSELLKSKEIDEEWANDIAKQFLSENAKRIYRL